MGKDLSQFFQVLSLSLDDGRTIEATVPAFCDPAETGMPTVTAMQISDPQPVPPGMRYVKMPVPVGIAEVAEEEAANALVDDPELTASLADK